MVHVGSTQATLWQMEMAGDGKVCVKFLQRAAMLALQALY